MDISISPLQQLARETEAALVQLRRLTAVGERVSQLIDEAHELDRLAEQVDWMLPADPEVPVVACQLREHQQRRGTCRLT